MNKKGSFTARRHKNTADKDESPYKCEGDRSPSKKQRTNPKKLIKVPSCLDASIDAMIVQSPALPKRKR